MPLYVPTRSTRAALACRGRPAPEADATTASTAAASSASPRALRSTARDRSPRRGGPRQVLASRPRMGAHENWTRRRFLANSAGAFAAATVGGPLLGRSYRRAWGIRRTRAALAALGHRRLRQ